MSWQPVLEGGLKDESLETIEAIRAAMSDSEGDPEEAAFLSGGFAGRALLHAYLAKTGRGQDHAAIAVRCLQWATAAVAEHPGSASLYSGLAGVGWALAHLQGRLPGLNGENELTEIDEVLLEHLKQSPWLDTYDLIGGLVGLGVYALEGRRRSGIVACLECVIEHLAHMAERRSDGITWSSSQEWLPAELRDRYPRRCYNLGLAHGVPGVVALLGLACAARIAVDEAESLLEGAVRWLLAQQLQDGFPSGIELNPPARPTRLAWCYGDPGVAAALLLAARCVNEPVWEREAVAIARRAARRPADESGVVDAGLCHGAAGLGHLFNRMFQATGEECLADAARFWFERTLAMRRPGRGIGGFEAWTLGEDGEMTWQAEPGLLIGAAGIALALAAATSDVEPDWDRMMLVAVPPRPTSQVPFDPKGVTVATSGTTSDESQP